MATVTAARSVADGGIEEDDPAAATRSDDAASSMLEKGKRNKNGTKDIGIQAFDNPLLVMRREKKGGGKAVFFAQRTLDACYLSKGFGN